MTVGPVQHCTEIDIAKIMAPDPHPCLGYSGDIDGHHTESVGLLRGTIRAWRDRERSFPRGRLLLVYVVQERRADF